MDTTGAATEKEKKIGQRTLERWKKAAKKVVDEQLALIQPLEKPEKEVEFLANLVREESYLQEVAEAVVKKRAALEEVLDEIIQNGISGVKTTEEDVQQLKERRKDFIDDPSLITKIDQVLLIWGQRNLSVPEQTASTSVLDFSDPLMDWMMGGSVSSSPIPIKKEEQETVEAPLPSGESTEKPVRPKRPEEPKVVRRPQPDDEITTGMKVALLRDAYQGLTEERFSMPRTRADFSAMHQKIKDAVATKKARPEPQISVEAEPKLRPSREAISENPEAALDTQWEYLKEISTPWWDQVCLFLKVMWIYLQSRFQGKEKPDVVGDKVLVDESGNPVEVETEVIEEEAEIADEKVTAGEFLPVLVLAGLAVLAIGAYFALR